MEREVRRHKGGPERIRTAVDGFADHCLATRPQDPFPEGEAKIINLVQRVNPQL
jgi:hypothetical protein